MSKFKRVSWNVLLLSNKSVLCFIDRMDRLLWCWLPSRAVLRLFKSSSEGELMSTWMMWWETFFFSLTKKMSYSSSGLHSSAADVTEVLNVGLFLSINDLEKAQIEVYCFKMWVNSTLSHCGVRHLNSTVFISDIFVEYEYPVVSFITVP